MSATGTVRLAGALAVTEAADGMSATGTVRLAGALAVTEAADGMSATGTIVDAPEPERPFVPPDVGDFDLLWYAPAHPTKAFETGQTAEVGGPFSVTGLEYAHVEEAEYTVRSASSWGSDVAYIFATLDEEPGEIVCYFKTGSSIGTLPTLASLSDTTGTIPFWHLRLDGSTKKFYPECAYQDGSLITENLAYTTQDIFSTIAANTWYVYRIQIKDSYQARLTIETTGGSVIGECYTFGGNLPRIVDLKVFFELFGDSAADIVYGFFGAKSVAETSYSAWDSTGFVAGASMLTTPGSSWTGSLFNGVTGAGSVTWDSTNKEWDIVAQGYGAGAAYDIGLVTSGDVIEVFGKLNSMSAVMGEMEIALGFAYGVSSNEVMISSTGLFHATLTCNNTQASTQVLIGGRSGETNATFSVQDLLIIKNKIALGVSTSNPA
jgi:hypothetical protein